MQLIEDEKKSPEFWINEVRRDFDICEAVLVELSNEKYELDFQALHQCLEKLSKSLCLLTLRSWPVCAHVSYVGNVLSLTDNYGSELLRFAVLGGNLKNVRLLLDLAPPGEPPAIINSDNT